ncbi:putative AC transposase [Mycena sanguinolenta]|uniref:Putative AC transposase n=1 Tax=Mycena sanguinolenta TaxID=230812 RepID=A0A8H7DGW9_9AGAR|nr:putative AC transposase [Mycena sanguinolenta]
MRPVTAPASQAAQALTSGFARFNALAKSLSDPDIGSPSPATPTVQSDEERAEAECRAVIEDERIIDDELTLYEAEGILDESNPEFKNLDLVHFWESHQYCLPYMFRVAFDVLPVQASAVPCERVFSSSEETDTIRRSSLSLKMIEMLQILKFIYRQDRIKFCGDLVATERELSVIDVDPEVIDSLLAAGKFEEVEALINSSWGESE